MVETRHGPVIHAANETAIALGARSGMRLTDARALNPSLAIEIADPLAEAAQLEQMALWASRWSPLVEIDGDPSAELGTGGIRLDISGVAHLFGGERGLIADVAERFERAGFDARCAIAPTPGAAWALARYMPHGTICGSDIAYALASLPVAALRLSPQTTRTLERLGLKTIAALAGIERRSLARRFREADNPLAALDRACGRDPEPLTATHCPPPPRAVVRLAEPVEHPEAAPHALDILVPRLVGELEARKLGARHLSLSGYRVDGSVGTAAVATSIPTREPAHLKRLFADKAATLDPGFGFDAFALTADWVEPLDAVQDSLVEEASGEAEIARLIDRLSVKLGASKVCRPRPQQSYLPERSNSWAPALSDPAEDIAPSSHAPRPQRLLDRPEAIAVIYATPEGLPRRFVWRRAVHDIAKVAGPERIAPEWWRQPSSARLRDYYRVEDSRGRRYWIYREGLIGDDRGGAPNWFVHGLFG